MRKEYIISEKVKTSEKYIRKFLLDNSDTLKLTECQWNEIKFFKIEKHGGEKDEKFVSSLNCFRPFLIKRIVDNKYGNVEQFNNSQFTHYFYKLSPELKEFLNKETLVWDAAFSKNFYGFEDPTFYKNETIIGNVISHEAIVILYLEDDEKKQLEKEGVIFD